MKQQASSPLWVAAAAAVMLSLSGTGPVFAQDNEVKAGGAYDRLPTARLIKQLSFLGMTELLKGMEQEIAPDDTSAKAQALRGRIRIGLANAMADPAESAKLIDEAIPLLQQAIKQAEKKVKLPPAEELELFRWTLELAVAMGRYRVENPCVLRLRYLQGGPEDRATILKYTKQAVEYLDILKDDVRDGLERLRADLEIRVLFEPSFEDLRREVRYNAAWVRVYRAMALPPGPEADPERAQLCRDAIAEMRSFTTDPDSGVMYWALYVTGIAQRLLRQHDEADKTLGKAAVPEAGDNDLRLRAWFERARNRIEEGDPAKAAKAIDDFKRGSEHIWGQQGQVMVDLRVVLLRNYLYELQASKEKSPAKAQQLRDKAQDVLLGFVEKYASRREIVMAFLDIVATKFADVKDLSKANAIVILARAYSKLGSKKPEDKAEAEDLLKRVLSHPDLRSAKIAQSIRPGVLWELAMLMNEAKRNSEAAAYFVALARGYPKHNMAFSAAKNAVLSFAAVLRERLAKGQMIGRNLRLEYIRALDTLLNGWGQEEGVPIWNYDLATQCMSLVGSASSQAAKLYWQGRAIAAYEKVPSSLVEYMESQHSALGLRTEIVLARDELVGLLKADNEQTTQALKDLARLLIQYDKVAGVDTSATTTAPAAETDEAQVTQRADALRTQLADHVKVYSDPKALIQRLKSYSVEAGAESKKVKAAADAAASDAKKAEQIALADGLREWAADADYQAAVIKYEQLPRGMKPDERQAIEKEALGDLQKLITKWPGTSMLRNAYEFEIRKLIQRGQTPDAIAKVKDFEKLYPEQAKQLIELVVDQIRRQIERLQRRLRDARTTAEAEQFSTELSGYQLAYANFTGDLLAAVEDLPFDVADLDQAVREIEALEKRKDFDGILKQAQGLAALADKCRVDLASVKASTVLTGVMSAAAKPDANKAELLSDLTAALINTIISVRDVVLERYRLHQMYGDSLIERGRAHERKTEAIEAKRAFQDALTTFEQCRAADEARRGGEIAWIQKRYQPWIDAIATQAKGMDSVGKMVAAYRGELVAAGEDPNKSADLSSLMYAYQYLKKADSPAMEAERLPRAIALLKRGWENLLTKRKRQVVIDHVNIIGLARAYWGLRQYGKAMEFYRMYTEGIPENSEFYWDSQLERCRCHFEGYRTSLEGMKNLVIHIRMLAIKDPAMGGKAREFQEILRKAQQLIEKLQKGTAGGG